ncbi:glycosyltransferase family 2 protein [Megasphaera elsdenii]|uniref:glycosyltransferase family 2 protein n=2 Tax=Megasphaera TaxID=906 RepID=UPI00147669B0|nr:glycosyltransferase family 2 protein [Megasphaera elsdenii]NME19504.1 glycosyltransferase family 2 protein [Megasphaera elsdenii]
MKEKTHLGKQLLSILVPCYNEEAVLPAFYQRTSQVIADIPRYDFQFIFVNDGSKDHTLDVMRELREKDSRVSYVNLSRNFGKEIAMIAGIDYLTGDAAIIMDADLQDPPELIPEMIYWWEKGYQDVSAKRRSRAGESFFKKWSSHAFYTLLQKVSDVPMQRDVGDFRLLDRQCLNALRLMRESQRYTKGLFSWIGFEKKEILFDRDARAAGKTKWNYWKLFNLAIEGITSFTIAPLRTSAFVGCILALISILYMLFIVIRTIIYGDDVPGYPSLISIVLFIGGIQLFFLGVIGEYLGRIFNESKSRPLYLVQDFNGERVMEQKKGIQDYDR